MPAYFCCSEEMKSGHLAEGKKTVIRASPTILCLMSDPLRFLDSALESIAGISAPSSLSLSAPPPPISARIFLCSSMADSGLVPLILPLTSGRSTETWAGIVALPLFRLLLPPFPKRTKSRLQTLPDEKGPPRSVKGGPFFSASCHPRLRLVDFVREQWVEGSGWRVNRLVSDGHHRDGWKVVITGGVQGGKHAGCWVERGRRRGKTKGGTQGDYWVRSRNGVEGEPDHGAMRQGKPADAGGILRHAPRAGGRIHAGRRCSRQEGCLRGPLRRCRHMLLVHGHASLACGPGVAHASEIFRGRPRCAFAVERDDDHDAERQPYADRRACLG